MSEKKYSESGQVLCGKIMLVLGIVLLLQTMGILSWRLWEFVGPLFLIGWGILLIRRPESFACCCFFNTPSRSEKRAL